MIYFADLHVHSRFSRATSRDCALTEMAKCASLKGVRVVATGDFTHPGWRAEINETLIPCEDGLFRIRDDKLPHSPALPEGFPPSEVRFIINVEISSIYKKNGSTRRVHNLVFMPDFEAMERFSKRLGRLGNIESDGRPILGIDARDILEIALDASEDSFLIPAHVWTPWFSALGSKSGFDSIEECFGDLSPHVFALETGLSSDPDMNRLVSALDRYTLVSNSDTHSPGNLAREVNVFEGTPGYIAVRESIRKGGGAYRTERGDTPADSVMRKPSDVDGADTAPRAPLGARDGFIGTIEFFPEEGKYHLDGHRKCGVRLDPLETVRLGGRCPECGRPVTVGVMNRVVELADRDAPGKPEKAAPFWRMIPLAEIVAESVGVGPKSIKVRRVVQELVERMGPELHILWGAPTDHDALKAFPVFREALSRVRRGEVLIEGGYDGEYGTIHLFSPEERSRYAGQGGLLGVSVRARRAGRPGAGGAGRRAPRAVKEPPPTDSVQPAFTLDKDQARAVSLWNGPVVVQAGPGTGKTATLTRRVVSILDERRAKPDQLAAVTFTRKAADEMRSRLGSCLGSAVADRVWVGTFHQLGARLLAMTGAATVGVAERVTLGRDEALKVFRDAVKGHDWGSGPPERVSTLFDRVRTLKQSPDPPMHEFPERAAVAYRLYEKALARMGAMDLDDLVLHGLRALRGLEADGLQRVRHGFAHLLVDEFQDVNAAQYEMIRILAGERAAGLFVIGDPDQAIYGFRGADRRFFFRIVEDYPHASQVVLRSNYRSVGTIVAAAEDVVRKPRPQRLRVMSSHRPPVSVGRFSHAAAESAFIAQTIDRLLGGTNSRSAATAPCETSVVPLGFSDFAVLYRLNAVGDSIEDALKKAGFPTKRARTNAREEEADLLDSRTQAISLMTMHAAKGLEWRVVFVVGCEDGVLPYDSPDGATFRADPEEERRLLYVAMTRARDVLFLTSSQSRTIFGVNEEREESPFLAAISGRLLERVEIETRRVRRGAKNGGQRGLF